MEQKQASTGTGPRAIIIEPTRPTVSQIEGAVMGVVESISREYQGRHHTLQELQQILIQVDTARRVAWAVGTVTRGMDTPIDELDRLWISVDQRITERKREVL